MPKINQTEYNLDVTTLITVFGTPGIYAQTTSGIATVCVTNIPQLEVTFQIETNQYGIFLLSNTTYIKYTGCVYLAPNAVHTLSLVKPTSGVQWLLNCTSAFDVSWSPTLAWISAVSQALTDPPPRQARKLAVLALCIYQAIVSNSTEFDRAVANEAAYAAVGIILPSFNRTALYNSFPKLNDPSGVQTYVAGLITTLAYPAQADNPVYSGPPPICVPPFLWTGSNPVLPNWSQVPYLANTYTAVTPNPSPTIPAEATQLVNIDNNLTLPQTRIALYFATSPPAHLTAIVLSMLAQKKFGEEVNNSQIMALILMALSDAGVYAWTEKYRYWGIRPIQYISGFQSLIPTPNFPGYISGHSTFSAAVAEMLSKLVPECGAIMQHIADVSGISRLYGGIHFSSDNVVGLAAGRSIADSIFNNKLTEIQNRQVFI